MSNNKSRWYFSKEALINTPSRKCGMDYDKELSNRQQAASLIQDMGRLLNVNQLCINTAIVYMHRFYVFHSFQRFHRNPIAACALFLAAKVEEQPRKLEYVIKVAHKCLNNGQPPLDPKSEAYQEQAQELIVNENIMLQTLGFDIAIEHPHTFVVKCCQLVRVLAASKDLAQTSYFMATNSLHLTTMCLQYRPTVVACVCIHLACKWSNWEIPKSTQGKDWFYYVDADVTQEMLEELTSEFLAILDKCPSRLKRKILSGNANQGTLTNEAITHLTPKEDRKVSPVKTETKSKPVASTSGYNQPSTSKANGQTSSMPIPTFSSNEKSAPSPPAKKLKEEPSRTHYMSHSSQASGQLSNVHNLPSMDVHNTTTDNRQRSQSSKDDKKLSLLENEAKIKERKQGQISNVHNLSNMDVHNTTTDNRQRSQPNKEDRKVSPVKTETKPKPVAPPSGFNQPSTSKANVQSISTPIPSSSLNKKQSPEPPARKIKEEPIRTHSMSHSSQASGQLSNVHNLPSMDVHNTTSDSRQRHQPIKDDKIHSLLESETKGKERKQGQISNVHNLSSMDVHNTIPENRQRYQSLKEERKVSPVKTEAKSKPIAPSSFNQASTSKANGQSISTPIPSFSLNKKQSPSPPPIKRKEEPIRTHYMSHSSQASGQISNAHNLPSMDEKKLKEESIRTHYMSHTSQPTGQLPTLHNIASMDDRRLKEESIRTNYMSHTSQPPGQPPNLHNLSSMDVHNTPTDNRQPSQSIKDDKILSHLNSEFKEPEENEDSLDEKSKSKDKHHHRHHRHHKNQHHHRHHEHKKHHKDKHKSKHKHKDRDRERHRNDHEEVNHRDKDFKLTLTVPKEEKSEEEIERPSPIKLKISKKQINYSGSESELNSEPSIPPSSLRVVISKERLGGNSNLSNHTMTRSDNVNLPSTSSSRKRKNSPKDELSFQERDLKMKKEKLSD